MDVLIVFGALHVHVSLAGQDWNSHYFAIAIFFVLVFELTSSASQMYRSHRIVRMRYELSRFVYCWIISAALVIASTVLLLGSDDVVNKIIFKSLWSALLIVMGYHIAVRLFLRHVRNFGYDAKNVAFVGANKITSKLRGIFACHPWVGMNTVGVYDDRVNNHERISGFPAREIAGNPAELVRMARSGQVDIVYFTLPMSAEKRIKHLIDEFADTTVSIYYCPSLFSFDLMNAHADDVFGQPVISVIETPFTGSSGRIKLLEDSALLLLLSPVVITIMCMISIAVLLTSRGPVFFRQSRYGLDGKKFVMYKFRTMHTTASDQGFPQAQHNDPRVTKLGRFLRTTSLDELPQFINVLKGEMSVVGPRPHPDIVNEVQRQRIHRYMVRHKVRPGITGLAQVSGFRGETDTHEKMEQRIALDLEYIKNWSVWLDLKILYRTSFSLSGKHVY